MAMINPFKEFTFLMKSEPKTDKKKPSRGWIIDESKCFTKIEVEKLRKQTFEEKTSGIRKMKFTQVRNWFMVELGLNVGLRVTEMAELKHSNVLVENNKSSIVLIGKGNKKRTVTISSSFKKTFKEYCQLKYKFGYDIDRESNVLVNVKGTKISKRALQKFFKRIILKSGLPNYFSIHCLRHTYATFLLWASGYNYRFVQKQLGHSSIRTTQIYASVVDSEGKKAVERLYK